MNKLNIIVVGTGMYACGRGTDGYGTVLPAVLQWGKTNDINSIYLVGTDPSGAGKTKSKINQLSRGLKCDFRICYLPGGKKKDNRAYLKAIRNIPKPACAIVAVPDNLHVEIASATIRAGIHTLVVKPLAPTLKEVNELISLQARRGVYCAVEFHKRFDLANLKLKDVIAKKIIGDPLYFLVEYSQRKSIPYKRFKKWVTKTNIFQYLGIHYVDIIYFVTGAKPVRAMAIGQKGWLLSRGINAYDSVEGIIEWKMPSGNKFSSHILTNWVDPETTSAMSDQKIKVIGTKGRFESNQKNRGIKIVTDEKSIEEPNPYFCQPYGTDNIHYQGYGVESINRFLNDTVRVEQKIVSVKSLEENRPTFKQSLAPTAALEAINKSLHAGGKWVLVKGV